MPQFVQAMIFSFGATFITFPITSATCSGVSILSVATSITPTSKSLPSSKDSNFSGTGLHTGFALDQSGDALYLYESAAGGGAVLDSIVFGPQAVDFSIGRTGANLNTLTICTPTPEAPNLAVSPLGQPVELKLTAAQESDIRRSRSGGEPLFLSASSGMGSGQFECASTGASPALPRRL